MKDIEETIETAGIKYIVNSFGEVIDLEQLLIPSYSTCVNCPIKTTCPEFEADSHCKIEEALVIRTVQHLADQGIDQKDSLTMFSFLNNLLMLHRLQRMAPVIDYGAAAVDRFAREQFAKYLSMLASVDRRYIVVLKELMATRKERRNVRETQDSGFMDMIAKAIEAEQFKEEDSVDTN